MLDAFPNHTLLLTGISMKRDVLLFFGVSLVAFVGFAVYLESQPPAATMQSPSPPLLEVPKTTVAAAPNAEPRRDATFQAPPATGRALDENEIAKAIVEENATWLFQLDAAGKRVLSPLGERYTHYLRQADSNGISGTMNAHIWVVTQLSFEMRLAQAQFRNPLGKIEGCFIIAHDKQYLGTITRNKFAQDSILNEFGRYGGQYSSTSIFNDFGKYGGEFATNSPFNKFTSNPPKIFTEDGDFVAYLTVNSLKSPRIDPHVLIAFLKGRR